MVTQSFNLKQHPERDDLFVSPCGRIFKELHATHDSAGYAMVATEKKGQRGHKTRRHVIVCEAYHGPRPPGQVVRHKNGIPGDDREDNLEWGTVAQNTQDTKAHGRTTRGTRNKHAVLTEADVLEIRKRIAQGEVQREIAESYGVTQPTICDIKMGRTWSHI